MPTRLTNIPSHKYLDLLPELLDLTIKSHREQNRTLHLECIDEIQRIEAFYTNRIEKTFTEVLDSHSHDSIDVKISILQILIHEITQFKKAIQEKILLIMKKNKAIQYPIPATVNTLFYFLEKEKCLVELLEYFIDQQTERYTEQVDHIRNQIQGLYQLNKAKIRAMVDSHPVYEEIDLSNDSHRGH